MERPPPSARSETSIARKVGRRILQLIHAELSGEGSEVEFDVEDDPKGPRAANVVVTNAAPSNDSPLVW